jgi:uncharacterized protein YbjQ (UPF0145 family)
MEEKYGVAGTTLDGVFFTESAVPRAVVLGRVRVEVSRQNSNLTEVKRRMAHDARTMGANVVMGFRYGQRKHAWWENLLTLKWDTESWHGEGDAARL